MVIHGIIGRSNGVRPVRIGDADHVTERLVTVGVDKVDSFPRQKIRREAFFIGSVNIIAGLSFLISSGHVRTVRGILKFFPVPSVEHIAIVAKTEFPCGTPLRFARTVQMPLAGITGGVALAPQDFRESYDVVI